MNSYPRVRRPNWAARVQETYASIDELRDYDVIFGVAGRCGYDSAEQMWEENPVIGGSTNPADFGRIRS